MHLQYDYDPLHRVQDAKDATALQRGGRNPYQFYIADGVHGARLAPDGGQYTVLYDADHNPFRYIDELGRTTSATTATTRRC